VRNGNLKVGEIDSFRPNETEKVLLDKTRDEFMDRLMRIITEVGPSEHPLREQWDAAIAKRSASDNK
jgi:hypothetical protein